jgi:hypothetical protein
MFALFKSGSFLYADWISLFTWSELMTDDPCVGAAPAAVAPDALVPAPVVLPVAVEFAWLLLMVPVELSADPAWLPTLEGVLLLELLVLDCGVLVAPVLCALLDGAEADDCA